MKSVEVVIRFEGGDSDQGKLALYDAAMSLSGLARVINLITHAFSNENEVRNKIPDPAGVKTYLGTAKKGCLEETVIIEFSDKVTTTIGSSVIARNFWDYLSYSLAVSAGLNYAPKTPYVQRVEDSADATFEALAIELETSMVQLHRPIREKTASTITIVRPHLGDILKLDKSTNEYVSTSETSKKLEQFRGNVTKYNALTGYGRAYFQEFGGTVPFNIDDFEVNQITHKAAAASLNEWVHTKEGDRKFVAHQVIGSSGRIKRILVKEILPVGD